MIPHWSEEASQRLEAMKHRSIGKAEHLAIAAEVYPRVYTQDSTDQPCASGTNPEKE